MTTAHAIIVGAGIIGLTTALELSRAGFTVTVVSGERPEHTTSATAGGICQLFGPASNQVTQWCQRSLPRFQQLAGESPESGVSLRRGRQRIRGIDQDELTVPVADMSVYLPWLMSEIEKLGGVFSWNEIQTWNDIENEGDLIINCSGMGARKLAGDKTLLGLRGQAVIVEAKGVEMFAHDESNPSGLTLVYPRTNDVWLGATWERYESRVPNDAATADLLERCSSLEPDVASGEVVDVRVGLRPTRATVRLEVDNNSATVPVVHNYGHGDNGVRTSWACAEDVVLLCRNLAR